MNYFEAFSQVQSALTKLKASDKTSHFAIQVRLSDEDACGTFYILLADGKIIAEPYDYYDNDVDIYTPLGTLLEIIAGKLDIKKAVSEKMISVSGNTDALEKFFGAKKASAPKKTTKKKTTAKTIKKKPEDTKMADEKKKPQEEDVIKEVVEKETKPKK